MTQAPFDFGPESSRYDVPGWMYLAVDEEGSPVLKVGWTSNVKQRARDHHKRRLTLIAAWPATKLDERDFHEEHRRCRTKLYGRETYHPTLDVVDWVVGAIEAAEENGSIKYPRGWTYRRVADAIEQRHIAWKWHD